jgi:hypothetical protein
MGVNGESPGWPGLSLIVNSIVADWMELLRKLYLFAFMELGGLGA